MKLWILSTPTPASEDTAYLIGCCTTRSERVSISKVEPTDDQAPAVPEESFDAVVNRSFNARDAFLRDLDQVTSSLGVPVINTCTSTLRACDKRCYTTDFPDIIPPTWVVRSTDEIVSLRDTFGAELVLKDPFGKRGEGIIRFDGAQDIAAAEALLSSMPSSGLVAQAFCAGFLAGDKRIILHRTAKGDHLPVAWFKRVPKAGSWKSNLSTGGQLQHCELTKEERELAQRVAKISGLDCVGVDTAWHEGRLLLIETNAYTGGHIDFDNRHKIHSGDDFARMVEEIATRGRTTAA